MQLPYLIIGAVVLLVAGFFALTTLPEIQENDFEVTISDSSVFSRSHFKWGVITLFFYVGAQTGIGSFFINYATEVLQNMSNQKAFFLFIWWHVPVYGRPFCRHFSHALFPTAAFISLICFV